MSEKRDVRLFTKDVFDSIDKISVYVSGMTSEKDLKNDKKTYDAVRFELSYL